MLEPHTCRCVWNAEELQKEKRPPSTFSVRKTKQDLPLVSPFVLIFNGPHTSGDGTFITGKKKRLFNSNYKLSVTHKNMEEESVSHDTGKTGVGLASPQLQRCVLRTGDLGEDGRKPCHAAEAWQFCFLTGDCDAVASARNYGEFCVLLFPAPQIKIHISTPELWAAPNTFHMNSWVELINATKIYTATHRAEPLELTWHSRATDSSISPQRKPLYWKWISELKSRETWSKLPVLLSVFWGRLKRNLNKRK